jgi:hypothetical protein
MTFPLVIHASHLAVVCHTPPDAVATHTSVSVPLNTMVKQVCDSGAQLVLDPIGDLEMATRIS